MKDDILSKLVLHLSKQITSEPDAMYLLAQLRELLRSYPKDQFSALRMCADWVLHTKLDRNSGAKEIIGQTNKYIEEVSQNEWRAPCDHDLYKHLNFVGNFRPDLLGFLRANNLPTTICENEENWVSFFTQFSGVINDRSLEIEGTPKQDQVSRMTYRMGRTLMPDNISFNAEWYIEIADSTKTITLSFNPFLNLMSGLAVGMAASIKDNGMPKEIVIRMDMSTQNK